MGLATRGARPSGRRVGGLAAWMALFAVLGAGVPAYGAASPAPAPAAGGGPLEGGDEGPSLAGVYDEGVRHVRWSELSRLYESVDAELRGQIRVDWGRFFRTMGREGLPGLSELTGAVASVFFDEVRVNAKLLARLLVLATLGAILHQLGRGLGGTMVQDVANGAVLFALVLLGLQSFGVAVRMVKETVQSMAAVAQSVLPTLGAVSVASGSPLSAAALHPLLVAAITAASDLVQRAVVPGLLLGGGLAIAGHITPDFPLSRLSGLAQQAALSVLGLTMTVFLGLVAVKGLMGPAADGLALRTAKYVTGATVPVVGRMMAEAVEVVAGGTTLIRGAVGTAGFFVVLLTALAPVAKLLAILFVYRLASALLQPVGDGRVVAALGSMSDTLGLLLASLVASAVFSLLAISVMVGVTAIPQLAR